MKRIKLQVIVIPNEDGYYVAKVPALPACVSRGKSQDEALTNVKTLAQEYMEALGADNYELTGQCQMSEVELTF